jgi:phage gp36-like protein
MAYATVLEFVAAVTEAEAAALARSATPPPAYDAAQIQRALDDASAELDTYFAARYATPLSPVPRTAARASIALAREALDRQGRDHVKAEAARWRTWARDVARAVAVLGGGDVGEEVPAPSTDGGVRHSAPDRVFNDDTLNAFTGGGA